MADQIINCVATKDDQVIIHYDVSYVVEYNAILNSFCVVVKAEELEDASDLNEVKSKANAKAKVIKDAWIADLPDYSSEEKTSLAGEVTL